MRKITYDKVVADIYDASLSPCKWDRAAQSLSSYLDGDTSIFFFVDHNHDCKNLLASHAIDLDFFNKLYTEYYYKLDPWNEPLLRYPEAKVANHVDMGIDMNNFVKSEYFNDFWSKAGLHHTSGARIELDDAICMFGVHRKKEKEAFSREDLLRFQSLIPHIKRSLHLYNDYLSTEDYTAIAPELFLNANVGFIALDSKFNFIQTNEIAENILLRGDGLVRKGTKLNAIIENENKLLYKILNSYKLTNKDISKNKLIYISRPNNITSYAVNIIPSFEKHDLLQTNDINASYYVFIIDPDISSTHKLDNFSNFYGLTEAEQKVLKFIVNGNTIQQIAEKHKLSKETIRTHMKSCFYKTQTHSQSQLINKALKETYGI